MANVKPAVVGALIVVGLGVGFGGGYFFRNYQLTNLRGNFTQGGLGMMNGQNVSPQKFNGNTNGNRGMGQIGMVRGGATVGTILSMDDKSITVKMPDGSSKIVLFSDSTTYSNTVTSLKTDLKEGAEVSVFGTPNSDGSLTATNIQLNPIMFKPQMSPVPQK